MKEDKKYIAIGIVVFIVYNVLVFLVGGIKGHSTVFWLSYLAALISMAVIAYMLCKVMSSESNAQKLLFLGYSVFSWSGIFLCVQLAVTTVFMAIDRYLKVAVGIEIVLLAGYIVIILLCFKDSEVIKEVQQMRQESLQMMQMLVNRLQIAESICEDVNIQKEIKELKDEFRYSDSVSSPETIRIEEKMASEVETLINVCNTNPDMANQICKMIGKQLIERNVTCKTSKRRY